VPPCSAAPGTSEQPPKRKLLTAVTPRERPPARPATADGWSAYEADPAADESVGDLAHAGVAVVPRHFRVGTARRPRQRGRAPASQEIDPLAVRRVQAVGGAARQHH